MDKEELASEGEKQEAERIAGTEIIIHVFWFIY